MLYVDFSCALSISRKPTALAAVIQRCLNTGPACGKDAQRLINVFYIVSVTDNYPRELRNVPTDAEMADAFKSGTTRE